MAPVSPIGGRLVMLLVCTAAATVACGKKGPPLPPLRLVPGPVTELSARRAGGEVQLRFAVPTTNQNGPGRIDLDRIEVYAVTVAPGTVTPANRELLTKAYAVGVIAVKPPPVEGEATEPAAGAPPDPRPAPGDHTAFLEQLTDERLRPAPLPKVPTPAVAATGPPGVAAGAPGAASTASTGAPAPPGAATPPAGAAVQGQPAAAAAAQPAPVGGAAAAPAATTQAPGARPPAPPPPPPPPTYIVRTYVLRGITKSGRPGQPSERMVVPLVDLPPAPTAPRASFTETVVALGWTAPTVPAGAPPVAFNVYRPGTAPTPLNPAPLTTPGFELPITEFGKQQCFVVRGVQVLRNVRIESDATGEACVMPKDIFPPAPPQGLSLVLIAGAIELVWDPSTEPDLAGYTVLRGEVPGGTLRPLTPSPIRETTFRDTNVTSGALYAYVVVAIDRTGNASAQSVRIEGTAR